MVKCLPIVLAFIIISACTSPSAWRLQYLNQQINIAGADQVREGFGAPTLTQRLENDDIRWIYQIGKNAQYGDAASYGEGSVLIGSGECIAYLLDFDQQRILRSWVRREC